MARLQGDSTWHWCSRACVFHLKADNERIFSQHLQNRLLPDHTYAVVSGGDPLCIPDLTWEQLRRFHATHYHPSNARWAACGGVCAPCAECPASLVSRSGVPLTLYAWIRSSFPGRALVSTLTAPAPSPLLSALCWVAGPPLHRCPEVAAATLEPWLLTF